MYLINNRLNIKKATPLKIVGIVLIEPKVFSDECGYFFESFNQTAFNQAIGYEVQFVQDNHSKSQKGVLRGLHLKCNAITKSLQ